MNEDECFEHYQETGDSKFYGYDSNQNKFFMEFVNYMGFETEFFSDENDVECIPPDVSLWYRF